MALLLENLWRERKLNGVYPLWLMTGVARTTLEFLGSMLEYMSDAVARSFEGNKETPFRNPFAFRRVFPLLPMFGIA